MNEELSDSYLHIREMLKDYGSYKTEPAGKDIFKITEQALKDLLIENKELEEEINFLDEVLTS